MALKSVTGGGKKFITPDNSFGTTQMEVGASIEGYLLLIDSYTDKDDLLKTPMYIQDVETNKVTRIYPSGNIKYAIQDGKLTLGQFIQITRIEDTKVKGRTSSQFTVNQDDEVVLENLEGVLDGLYKKSAELYKAKKDAEGTGTVVGGTVTKGMTRNDKARANTAAKAKLLD